MPTDVTKEDAHMTEIWTDNDVAVKHMIRMTKKNNLSDCYHVTFHC